MGFGFRSDRGSDCRSHTDPLGKFRPYLLYLAVPFALIGIFTFTTPELNDTGKLVYAYITYSLMMMVYSAINVPYASLLGVMSPDPKERNTLSTYRMTFAYIGSFIALLLFMPMVNLFGGAEDEQRGWMLSVVVIAVMCAALFYLCFALTRERVKPIRKYKLPERRFERFASQPSVVDSARSRSGSFGIQFYS